MLFSGFNPTLVRLRRGAGLPEVWGLWGFQSHAGSIEARSSSHSRWTALSGFQSHAGSIEAYRGGLRMSKSISCFNPTLVRLRPAEAVRTLLLLDLVSIPRWFD